MRNFFIFILGLLATTIGENAYALEPERLARLVQAYGGAAALNGVAQVETEWVGYFYGRYQSRRTDPPYDRVPIRSWSALDLAGRRSVTDNISTYPGELNLGLRVISDGSAGLTLNTISRLYAKGAMFSHDSLVETSRNRMPWMVVREMIAIPSAFEAAGRSVLRGITYDLIRRGDVTYWVHPDTSLIHAATWVEESMVDVKSDVMRTYTDYYKLRGVMVNRRTQAWSNGEVATGHELHWIDFNRPVDAYLRVPDGFLQVASLEGYNGVADIGVERVGDGVFLAGSGDTRVLYVEFDDHFVAMEAGGMLDYAERTYHAMRPHMRGKPLRYIIPTHHHDDHAVAVHFYARVGATILTTRDKEGFMRRLLARSWGNAAAVTKARFRFIDNDRLVLEDRENRLEVHVYENAPHTQNMLVGYVGRVETLYSCDVFIGWAGEVRQGASYGSRHLSQWIKARRVSGVLGPVRNYASCHGRAYSAADFDKMLGTERTIVALPNNEAWPTATWPERFGLSDDTTQGSQRSDARPRHDAR